MERLKQYGLVINEEKYQLFKTQVEFLCNLLPVEGITKCPRPSTCSQLLSFLGMINF